MTTEQPGQTEQPSRRYIYIVPLGIFLAVLGFLLFGLRLFSGEEGRNPNDLPSVLIGKPVPAFALEPLKELKVDGQQLPGLGSDDFKGKITVVNFWASWCIPCRQEHPALMKLAEQAGRKFRLTGINYKDEPANGLAFLAGLGNPFDAVGTDIKGRVGIDFGVYGVPETFIIGPDGTILHKHVGPLLPGNIDSFTKKLDEAIAGLPAGAP